MRDFVLAAQHAGRTGLELAAKRIHPRLALGDLGLELVKPVARQLGVQMLKLRGKLLVAPGLAGLALERDNLALHLADQVGDAQQVLLGVFQLAQRLFLLGLKPGNARRLLEDHPPILRFAGEDLRDVALRHDAIAGAPHAGAHEQLLDIPQPARRPINKILAATVTEDPPGKGHLVIHQFHARRRKPFRVHPSNRQRHLRHAQRLAAVRPVKNHIRHLAAPQGLGGLLAQYPTDSV